MRRRKNVHAFEGDLAAAYLKLAPEYGAYVLSVILIGLYWAHSHFSGKLPQKTDHGYNLLSIGFLAAVTIASMKSYSTGLGVRGAVSLG